MIWFLLREFFEEAGYYDLLPLYENCIPMIPQFQNNLPKMWGGRRFPMKLEILFTLFFSSHHLVEKNHRVLVDALQLRLMAMLFKKPCKPPSQRDLTQQPKTTRDCFFPRQTIEKKKKKKLLAGPYPGYCSSSSSSSEKRRGEGRGEGPWPSFI